MIRAVIRFLRFLVSPWRRGSLTATPVHVPGRPESLLDETCRRAAELAALDPEQVIAEGGPLERFVRGRHAAHKDELSERTAERMAALQGDVDAQAADELAARAAPGAPAATGSASGRGGRGRVSVWPTAETTVTRLQQERDKLSLREKGYLGGSMKWLLVILVAAALTPLVYMSMEFLDDPFKQMIVMAASRAGILVAEHALGFAIAHVAQHVPRWAASRRSSGRDSSSGCASSPPNTSPASCATPSARPPPHPAGSTQRTPRRASSPTPRRSSR